MPTILQMYQVTDRAFVTISGGSSLSVIQCLHMTGQLYVTTYWNSQKVDLDATRILLHAPQLPYNQNFDTFLGNNMSDEFVAIYTTNAVPKQGVTGRYPKRLHVYDPVSQSGFQTNVGDMYGNIAPYARLMDYDDLIIKGPPDQSFTSSIVSINGVIHNSVANGSTLFVKEGYRNIKTKGAADVMIADTSALGGHTVIPLTQDMLEPVTTDPWLGVTVNLGSVDLSNSTVLLVVDGYLHILDSSYSLLGKNRLYLKVPHLNLIQDFVHNPNVTFNPTFNISDEQKENPYEENQPDFPDTPAVGLVGGYAEEIGVFLLQNYAQITSGPSPTSIQDPALILGVGFQTFEIAQRISQFFRSVYPNITAAANSLAIVPYGPPPGTSSVLQEFLTCVYPTLLNQTPDPGISAVGLMLLSPIVTEPEYIIQDILINKYPYLNNERGGRDVALVAAGLDDGSSSAITSDMTQFFTEYYPDMNKPSQANPNNNVAITELESLTSYRISLQGKRGLDLTGAQTHSFLYDRLFSPTSFLIVLANASIFVNRYRLNPTGTAHRFEWAGNDTPRGLLKYNHRHFLPYTILAAADFNFLVHIGTPDVTTDVVQTSINPTLWPAPHYDVFDASSPRSAEMIELFSV